MMDEDTIREAIPVIKARKLTDEEARELAEYEKSSHGDFHAWTGAPVVYEDGDIRIGTPGTFAGNEYPQWSDNVLGTIGLGPSTPEGIRRSFSSEKTRILRQLRQNLRVHQMEFP